MMPVDRVVHQPTKFETQCVTDTQLINVIENAEIVDKHRGVTQEFEKTFCQNTENTSDDKLNDSRLNPDTITDTGNDIEPEIISTDRDKILDEHGGVYDHDSKLFDNSDIKTCDMDTVTCYQIDLMTDFNDDVNNQETQGFDKCVKILNVSEVEADRPVSPVLNTYRKSTTPPLVVDLYAFEIFENLANPIIEEHEDMTMAKNMINSQIIGREILIPAHNSVNFDRDSPVLSKIDCITTNLNNEDVENICTCSNNCVDKDVKCTNEPTSEDISLTSRHKKTQSNPIKTEIKDEILFSSDEEYEYLHKNIQELPLTCALETSFYDRSDVLDKTMYVGFQTASNKSIQINTVSFTKAKSILSEDNEGTGATLSDLVEIFDSGKAVSENVQSLKFFSNKLEFDIDNETSSKIELSNNLIRPSNEFEEKRDDTFENVSLTALERDREGNDEIVASQIINFKSTSRSVKLNDSIMSEGKVIDTFDNVGLTALEQNKEMDDDIMMSQVITFKSISRTPAPSVTHESSQLGKVIAKRKLEGFKTASNKKIKLSDKALTRCRKVFQDIDLGDSEYMSSKSNIAETEEIDEDFKFHDFNISYDASRASSNVDNTSKESENYICDNIASNKMISEDCDSETISKVKEKQPAIEDADLQINDQMILQEFEEIEMPLKETNNNSHVTKARYENMADSDVAIETKNIFQDRISAISTTINSDTSIKTADSCIDSSDKHKNVFKKPAAEFRKGATKRTKSTNIMSDIPDIIPQKEDDHEIYDTREPATKITGFKTASHKEIIISERAKEKSRDFYRDLDILDKEIPQNVNIEAAINSNSGNKNHNIEDEFNCGIDTQDFLAEELTHIEELFKDNVVENEKPNPIVQGFQTASRKAIAISEKALEKSKKLFEDITDNESDYKCPSTKENVQVRGISDKIETQKSQGAHTGLEDFDNESQSTDPKPPTNRLVGFQIASNKKINISAKALTKSKKLLNDFEVKDKNNDNGDHDKKITDNLDSHLGNDGIRFKESDATNDLCQPSTSKFIGFQTASNKAVKISNEALARSKKLFQDVDIFDNECDALGEITTGEENSMPVFKGFQTASNENVSIRERALDKSKNLFQDVENCTFPKNAPVFQGFQTASNKTVKISEKALASSKKLFDDFNLSQFNKDSNTILESNGLHSNKDVTNYIKGPKVSDQEFARTKYLQVEKVNDDSNPVFRGFQTASYKQMKISEKALANSKKLFEDINLSQLNTDPITAVDSNGLHRNKTTAKGVINDIRDTINSNHENKIVGFQTASNKTVSEQDLAKTKDICKDLHVEKENNDSTPVFRGFQTARNKQVKISEKALAKSKKLFEDINLSQYITETKPAVHTDIVNYIKDPIVSNHENNFAGFQTASNKKVIVSDRAMAKTKDIFKDIDIDEERDKNANDKAPVFKGFQTASNNKVAVSEKALAKSKKLFEDINLSQIEEKPKTKADINKVHSAKVDDVMNKIKEPVSVQEHKNNVGGFKTASNRKVNIPEQAFAKSKDIYVDKENDIHVKNNEIKTRDLKAVPEIDSINDINKDVIDTQILNDFESTLNTEDFCKSTPVSKRSGSPILSCPRAKKRKFETPYRSSKKIETRNPFVPPKLAKIYNFNNEYKKHKKYTLEDIEKLEKEYTKADIDASISEYNFDSLLNFVFKGTRNDYTNEKITIEALKKTFLGSVNKKIVPEGWLDNHIKLIIWKLLSYELKFPNVMKNTCTVRNVLEQLKYRYDRELYHVQRPILRKILEKDEVPSKTMVLCVAAIYSDNVSVTSVQPSSPNVELLVTDGWYCVKACLDRMLIRLVASGAIVVGTKIAVCGAELINCEQGIAPWEDTSSVRLKLHGNSTRRARWLARLGPRGDVVPGGLAADGGRAAAVRLAVTRVYPPVTVERMEDGSTVTLSERLENIRQMRYESERQVIMEKLYEELEKEMSDLESQDSGGSSNEKVCIDSGSQIAKCMKKSKDPDEYRSHLTKSQNRMLEDHNTRQREKQAERVRGRFQEKLETYGLRTDRNVVQLLKARVAVFREKGESVEITKGFLSIWRPSAAVTELVTEGAWIKILNVLPTGIRNSEIQLSTGRQTTFNPYKQKNEKFKLYANSLQRKCYEIKEITQNLSMTTDYNEVDTVGMIFCVEPSTKEFHEQSFQNVYLADADKNIICVNFWGGLKKFGYENVIDTGQIVTCVNLQKRAGNTRKSIPQYRVTEFSYFTKTPKSKKALEISNELTNKLSKNRDKFCEDCIVLKNNYSIFKTRNIENISPYRFGNTKNIASPACDANLNLTGLDFESSFNSQDISPQALLRKRKVNEKIEKLRLNYGEPPPLSSIHIINQSKNASATYKSPLISNLERSENPLQNASSVSHLSSIHIINKSKNASATCRSPLISNLERSGNPLQNVASYRTLVKNVNPVRLNFSNELNESVDHFAEDFDASPPLSLDSDVVNK